MPIGYFLGVMSLVCGGGIASMIAASATYVLSKKLRIAKAALAATVTLLVVVVGLPALLNFLDDVKRGALNKPEAGDLVGTWKAVYRNIGFEHASGIEMLTLRADGTYQQIYEDGKGYAYTSPWYKWWLDEGAIVHLEHGRFYLNGITEAEMIARGDARIVYPELTLDGTKIILYVRRDSNAPGGLILEHLPVGDGDSPDIVQFYRESSSVPTTTGTP
jgi:hypothetical protein